MSARPAESVIMTQSTRLWRLVTIAATAAGLLTIAPIWPDRAAGQPEYALYYSFDIPMSIGGIALSDDGTKKTFNGSLRGTIGGVQITDAKYSYANGASLRAGGGTFSMTTTAGSFKDGRILMTNEGKQTTLLFFGMYLGARVSFVLVSPSEQLGGTGVTMRGLAETTFPSHEHYVAAVRDATATLAPTARDQVVTQADQNVRLVKEYEQRAPH
jgi:hypothetical protein